MTKSTKGTFDTRWDEIYDSGQMMNKYPWDLVVSFLFRYGKKFGPGARLLELGCGAASNLIFAVQEGFKVAGIDGAASAVVFAQKRFAEMGLEGDIRQCFFHQIPFERESFDLVIDRSALSYTGCSRLKETIKRVHHVLRPGGIFLFTPYTKDHSGYDPAQVGEDGLCRVEKTGIANTGHICFFDRKELFAFIDEEKWDVLFLKKHTQETYLAENIELFSSWAVGLKKK